MTLQGARSRTLVIPAATGGWNTRDPISAMSPLDAVQLDNFFPDTGRVTLRKGYDVHSATGLSTPVETLISIAGSSSYRLVAALDNKFYDVSTAVSTAITGTTVPTSNKWQHVVYKNVAICVNGEDVPQQIPATGSITDISYTGIANPERLIGVTVFRDRLYFIEKDTLNYYFGGPGLLAGALTQVDGGAIFSKGGRLTTIGTWTRESGSSVDDGLLLGTSEGEFVVYGGTNPLDAWAIVAKFDLPRPLGYRAAFKVGGDMMLISEQGVIPLSSVIGQGDTPFKVETITDKIQPSFTTAAAASGSAFGWEGVVYPAGKYTLINIPVTPGFTYHQYVVNNLTGAWCRFTGQPAVTWAVHQGLLYFGGINGTVYRADFNRRDRGNTINAVYRQAYNYCAAPDEPAYSLSKRFTMARPIMRVSDGVELAYELAVDFKNESLSNLETIEGPGGAEWDLADWDESSWALADVEVEDWYDVSGIGRAVSVQMGGAINDMSIDIYAHHIVYEVGGFL